MLSKSLALGALLLNLADGARVRRQNTGTKMIAGVTVHNYHKAFDTSRWDASMVASMQESGVEYWIAMMRDGISDAELKAACDAHTQCSAHGHGAGVPFIELTATHEELEEVLIAEKDQVKFVEPFLPVYATPEFDGQSQVPWGLRRVRARSLSSMPSSDPGPATGGAGVNVYVMDTGIRTTHSDFTGRAKSAVAVGGFLGLSLTECNGDPTCAMDKQGHGTHCAGTVGGASYGVAKAATLYAVKVLGDNGSGSTFGITNSLDWVATKAARPAVASMSLGGGYSAALNKAVDKLVNAGVTVVTAAGNENTDSCSKSPASAGTNINVASSDPSDSRSSFSNYGTCVHIFAPGRDVLSSLHTSDTASASYSGTSMACPHVSGAAAILLQAQPSLTPAQVKAQLVEAATQDVVTDAKGSPNLMLFSAA